MEHQYPEAGRRRVIALFALSAAFMTQLDATIANVALPHMQATTMASREQVTWVLTSYIVMSAIFTPLSGWLAERFGRKRVIVVSVIGFTLASALCGAAVNLNQLIAFRLLQGAMGASLLPMSQAVLLDINPPEEHGRAMALWGMGAIFGPIIGPLLGGWLTDNYSWRWVFYINLPIGLAATVGLAMFLPDNPSQKAQKFDAFGFFTLAVAIGGLQLVLDRGQLLDWFDSAEIRAEMIIAALAFYLFLVHSLTHERPFLRIDLFLDRNFLIGSVLGFFLAGLMYGVLALLPPMLSDLMDYPAELIGIVTAPRGVGSLVAMLIVGRLSGKVDDRILILVGLALCGWSTFMLTMVNLDMDETIVVVSSFVQGLGAGTIFVPTATVVFATIPFKTRNEGAALNSLVRSLGGAIWISILQVLIVRNTAVVHSRLVEYVRPDNPALDSGGFDFDSITSIARMAREVNHQAMMVSYTDAFQFLLIAGIVVMPLTFLLRRGKSDP